MDRQVRQLTTNLLVPLDMDPPMAEALLATVERAPPFTVNSDSTARGCCHGGDTEVIQCDDT